MQSGASFKWQIASRRLKRLLLANLFENSALYDLSGYGRGRVVQLYEKYLKQKYVAVEAH